MTNPIEQSDNEDESLAKTIAYIRANLGAIDMEEPQEGWFEEQDPMHLKMIQTRIAIKKGEVTFPRPLLLELAQVASSEIPNQLSPEQIRSIQESTGTNPAVIKADPSILIPEHEQDLTKLLRECIFHPLANKEASKPVTHYVLLDFPGEVAAIGLIVTGEDVVVMSRDETTKGIVEDAISSDSFAAGAEILRIPNPFAAKDDEEAFEFFQKNGPALNPPDLYQDTD